MQANHTAIKLRTKYVEDTHDQYLLPEVNALAGRHVSRKLFKEKSDLSQGKGGYKDSYRGSQRSFGSSGSPKAPTLHTKRTFGNIYCGYCIKDEK